MCEFYTRLYGSSNIENANIKSYIEKIKLQNILNEKQKMELEEFPSLKECDEATKMLKPNKSPSLDGLPGEFYQVFWNELKPHFYNSWFIHLTITAWPFLND
mgnify:CR=1 FL=1